MKYWLVCVSMLAALAAGVPASAHHMAEGIVSDELYDLIELNLAGTPHLDLDLTTIGTMSVLVVTVPEAYVADVLGYISEILMGSGYQRASSLEVDISLPDADGLVTLSVQETLGRGESQTVVPSSP